MRNLTPGTSYSNLKKVEEKGLWWHSSPSGDLRGGPSGLHLGTKKAAEDAIHARIGYPAEGSWDGTREYGKTKLAGQKTLRARGIYPTGYNCNAPEEDHYPTGQAKYGDGTPVPPHAKPEIAAYRLKGPMTNSPHTPHEDIKANALMAGQIKRGTAKRGYYYRNVGEDAGSLSIVVPHHSHVEKISQPLKKGERGDWEKEGYKLEAAFSSDGSSMSVHASHPDHPNVEIGRYTFNRGKNNLYVGESDTHPDHQRKGLATAAYAMAEKHFGLKLTPEPEIQTRAAKALWSQPKRPFGK